MGLKNKEKILNKNSYSFFSQKESKKLAQKQMYLEIEHNMQIKYLMGISINI